MPGESDTTLRQLALAVAVLEDIDLLPDPAGVTLPGPVPVVVPWAEVAAAAAPYPIDPGSAEARCRLAQRLRVRRSAAELGPRRLLEAVRPLGVPLDSPRHPGPGWARASVLGGAIEVGPGLAPCPDRPADVVPLPPGVADGAWSTAVDYLHRMGELAVDRLRRDPHLLRPMGGCDVVTLLASAQVRRALAVANHGICTLAAPMRDRGWTRLSQIDPAFVPAAYAATDLGMRGFPRPLLITADEVTMARDGGRPAYPPVGRSA